jgi:hypothetical protein
MAGTPLAQQGRRPIDQAQEFLRNNDLEGAVRFWGSLILSEPGLEPLVELFVTARLAQPRETILSFLTRTLRWTLPRCWAPSACRPW